MSSDCATSRYSRATAFLLSLRNQANRGTGPISRDKNIPNSRQLSGILRYLHEVCKLLFLFRTKAAPILSPHLVLFQPELTITFFLNLWTQKIAGVED